MDASGEGIEPLMSEKVWFITGASRGFGREWTIAALERGDKVAATVRDLASLEDLAAKHGDALLPLQLDVTDREADFAAVAQAHEHFGRLDIVVNNAGIAVAGGALDATDEQLDRLFGVNLRGVITGSREFGRQMVERGVGGHIVNISSAAAFTPSRSLGLYSSSKAGVLLFSESLRAELAEHRIGVTAICPGIVDTAIVSSTPIAGLDPETEKSQRDRLNCF